MSEQWENDVMEKVQEFENACQEIGGDVVAIGNLAQNCFRQFDWVLSMVSLSRKPSQEKLLEMVKPMTMVVEYASGHRDKKSLAYNHQSAFAFYIPICLWFMDPSNQPIEFIQTCKQDGEKYANKILNKFKGKPDERKHVQFVDALHGVVHSLESFVEQNYPNGLVWNEQGDDLEPCKSSHSVKETETLPVKKGSMNMNSGKWVISEYENDPSIVIPVESMNRRQGVYISNCSGSRILVGHKIKVLFIDGCINCDLHLSDVVSSVEILNCSGLNVKLEGYVPTVSIERSTECQIWLSDSDEMPQIVSSSIDQVNLLLPNDDPKRDHIETPVPHQFVTLITKTPSGEYSLHTEPVKHF